MDSPADGSEPQADPRLAKVARSPVYHTLIRERGRLGWALTGVMLAVYFGFILLVAFGREFLARPIAGSTVTLGIPIGIGIIVTGILLTGIYVRSANRRFDPLERQIRGEAEL